MDILFRIPSVVVPSGPAARGQTLVGLAKGQLVQATVQRVVGEQVLLNLGGLVVAARSEVPLQAQQRVLLEVVEADQTQVSLRLIGRADGATATSEVRSTPIKGQPDGLQALLMSWGLEGDEVDQAIARSLLAYGQTVSPEDVLAVRGQWQALPNHQLGDLAALSYLHVNRLPISHESLALAEHWLNGSPALAERLTDVQQALDQVLTHLRGMADNNPTLTGLRDVLQRVSEQLAGWRLSGDMPTHELATRLADLLREMGTPPEAELARRLVAVPRPITLVGHDVASPESQDADQLALGSRLIQPRAGLSSQEQTSAHPETAPTTGEGERSGLLRQISRMLSEVLADPKLDASLAQPLQRLNEQLAWLAKDLGATQLANLATPANPSVPDCYLFAIPMDTNQGTRTAYLRVYRQPEERSLDAKNLRIALLLDMPALGEMAISLALFEGRLSGQFLCVRPETQSIVEAQLGELREQLKALGLRVDRLDSEVLAADQKAGWWANMPGKAEITSLVQVDVSI